MPFLSSNGASFTSAPYVISLPSYEAAVITSGYIYTVDFHSDYNKNNIYFVF